MAVIIESIEPTDSGRGAFEKTDRNVKKIAEEITTTTTKKHIPFPYNPGFTEQGSHIKNGIDVIGNHVYVYINVKKIDGSTIGGGTSIGIIPANYRPDKEVWESICKEVSKYVIINHNGDVIVSHNVDGYVICYIDYYI